MAHIIIQIYLYKTSLNNNSNPAILTHKLLMIKQQQRVIRKGDYYQLQTHQQTMMLISKTKKEQQPNPNSTSNIPANQQIITEIPHWAQARDNYFRGQLANSFNKMELEELVLELERIAKEEGLRDEERNQIDMLSQEIVQFVKSQQLQLNSLPTTNNNSLQQAKLTSSPPHTTITLKAQYNISSITNRLSHLQSLDFPDLLSLQHQLQIMLGDKKPLQSLQLSHMDQKQRQQLTNLYNHLNSLSIMNNTQRVIDSVFMNQPKHVEMEGWLQKMQQIQGVNADLLLELKEDKEVLDKLEQNFDQNVKVVRGILQQLKGNR